MGFELRKKGKVVRVKKFVTKIKKIQEEAQVVLRKAQEEIKKQADCQRANSKSELSQLLFISVKQRELVKSLHYIGLIYLYRFYLVYALVSHTTM